MENHIIIGLGGTGGNVIKAFRKRLFQENKVEEINKMPIGYVYVDTSEDLMKTDSSWNVLGVSSQLGSDSHVKISATGDLRSTLYNIDNYPGIKGWIGNQTIWNNNIEGVDGATAGAGQKRRLGRFLFATKISDFNNAIGLQKDKICRISGEAPVTFHIIAGLAGGTGSGTIIDAIMQIRKSYDPQQYKIFLYCFLPEENPRINKVGYYHANGYAALMELNALASKQYQFRNVSGETEFIQPQNDGPFFHGAYLYSNVNENKKTVDTFDSLPSVTADFLAYKIFLKNGEDGANVFSQNENYENIGDKLSEADESATTVENRVPVRSKRFLSFGIYRILNPDSEITEYFTYQFAKQALLQLRYNNWNDSLGFRNDAQNIDFHSFVADKANLRNWMLTDEHLSLSLPILPADKDQAWKTIVDDWETIMPQLKEIAWNNSETSAINDLAKFCAERFEKNFRKTGVVDFYSLKSKAKRDIAREICRNIEEQLFDDWKNGQKALCDLTQILKILIDNSQSRLAGFDKKLSQIQNDIESILDKKRGCESDWSSTGFIMGDIVGKKKRLFEAYATILTSWYQKQTEAVAFRFAKELLAELIQHLTLLQNRVNSFSENLNTLLSDYDKQIESRCQNEETLQSQFKNAVIRYYDRKAVVDFADFLIKDKGIISTQATAVRNELIGGIGNEKSFELIDSKLKNDSIARIIEPICKAHAINAHNNLRTNNDGFIGLNIVEKLYAKYGNNLPDLKDFARKIIDLSGTFLRFKDDEVIRHLNNNDAPRPGNTIKIHAVIISIPLVQSKIEFIESLKSAFQNAQAGTRILFDLHNDSKKTNEISIVSITSCFPLRAVQEVFFLQSKYVQYLSQNDPIVAKQMLHIEGDGTQYPRIFALNNQEIAQEQAQQQAQFAESCIPTLLLSSAMELVKRQDKMDGTGRMAYAISQTDALGLPMPPIILHDTFVGAANAITNENFANLQANVASRLQNEFLHISKRTELQTKMVEFFKTVILVECNNNINTPVYQQFYKALSKAIEMLK